MSGNMKLYGILLGATFTLSVVFSGLSHLGAKSEDSVGTASVLQSDSVSKTLKQIQLAARIMPSQNTEGNKVLMDYKTENEKSGVEEFFAADQVDSISPDYFMWSDTANYFTTVRLTEDYLPLGSGKPMCLHVEWIKKEQRVQIDNYLSIQDLPKCLSALNPKVRWQVNDPRTGLTFKPWKQNSMKAQSESECSDLPKSSFVKINESQSGRCYSYDVVDRICLTVKYEEHPDTASYSWNYAGGCFENGEFAHYVHADIGSTYSLNKLPIEVRQVPGSLAERVTNSTGVSASGFFKQLSRLCLLAALVFLVLIVHQLYTKLTKKGAPSGNPQGQQFAPQVDE